MLRDKHNVPGIIQYPFWQVTAENSKATYACINYGEAYCLKEEGRAGRYINKSNKINAIQ